MSITLEFPPLVSRINGSSELWLRDAVNAKHFE